MDFEKLFTFGEFGKFINTVIEIPKNSSLKIEFDREKKLFVLDRVEPAIFDKPVNYGFIPNTTDEDGDPLDTLLITDEPVPTGIVVRCRVIAILNFVDTGKNDHKIVCVPEKDRHFTAHIEKLSDLTDQWKNQVEFHFNHYKDLKKVGQTKVEGWSDTDAAWKVIRECVDRFNSATK
ncbi:MAG TPA: inorganic diphosphatase [Candidatus Saccharimonadia bacterium]|nr:inorganic diphosphatase [Candidatus Saccharimonadia bacterium]